MKMFVWRKAILTNYTNGIVCVLANDVTEARILATDRFYHEDVVPNSYEGQDEWEWPHSAYTKFKKALEQEPEVYEEPTAVYKHGGD